MTHNLVTLDLGGYPTRVMKPYSMEDGDKRRERAVNERLKK